MIRNLFVKSISAALALTTAGTFINPRGGRHILMWSPKLLAAALTAILTLTNSLFLVFGMGRGDSIMAIFGAWGTLTGIRHISRVTKPREPSFNQVFGVDWEDQIPLSIFCNFIHHTK